MDGYKYHLDDIAEIEAMEKPIDSIRQMLLDEMKKEVREYELANPDKVATKT